VREERKARGEIRGQSERVQGGLRQFSGGGGDLSDEKIAAGGDGKDKPWALLSQTRVSSARGEDLKRG